MCVVFLCRRCRNAGVGSYRCLTQKRSGGDRQAKVTADRLCASVPVPICRSPAPTFRVST